MLKKAQRLRSRGAAFTRCAEHAFHVRVYRMILYMRDESETSMRYMFGQSPQNCARDAQKLIELAYVTLVPKWVKMPRKGSREYFDLVGTGVFHTDLPHVVYCADITPVPMPRPRRREKKFYDYHRSKHVMNMLTVACSHGYTRLVAGPFEGSVRDSRAIARSKLTSILKRSVTANLTAISAVVAIVAVIRSFVREGHFILYDHGKGVGLKDGLWLTPRYAFKRRARTSLEDQVSDAMIHRARVLIEQTYSRLKNKRKVFKMWKRSRTLLHQTFSVSAALANIEIATGQHMRNMCNCRICT